MRTFSRKAALLRGSLLQRQKGGSSFNVLTRSFCSDAPESIASRAFEIQEEQFANKCLDILVPEQTMTDVRFIVSLENAFNQPERYKGLIRGRRDVRGMLTWRGKLHNPEITRQIARRLGLRGYWREWYPTITEDYERDHHVQHNVPEEKREGIESLYMYQAFPEFSTEGDPDII